MFTCAALTVSCRIARHVGDEIKRFLSPATGLPESLQIGSGGVVGSCKYSVIGHRSAHVLSPPPAADMMRGDGAEPSHVRPTSLHNGASPPSR